MYRLGHIWRGIINVGLRKIIKIKGGVVKKPILCRYVFLTISLRYMPKRQRFFNTPITTMICAKSLCYQEEKDSPLLCPMAQKGSLKEKAKNAAFALPHFAPFIYKDIDRPGQARSIVHKHFEYPGVVVFFLLSPSLTLATAAST